MVPILINEGKAHRYHALGTVELLGEDTQVLLNLFDSTPYILPIFLTSMERHPLGSQAFIPLQAHPFIVVVAAKDNDPVNGFMPQHLHAFINNGAQGVNYHRGVWHHSLLALASPARFLVVDRGGEGDNCDVMPINGDVLLALN